MKIANFSIERQLPFVVLVDRGPWTTYPTITNSSDKVIRFLVDSRLLTGNGKEKFYYFDSEGDLTGVEVENGQETCFFSPSENDRRMLGA